MARALDAHDMLWIWEHGQQSSSSRRALLMLMAADPDEDWRTLAELPLGRRQRRLLLVRETTFGPQLDVFVTCPGCDAELEFELDTTEERQSEVVEPEDAPCFTVDAGEFELELRLPNTADVMAIEDIGDIDQARRELFSRCLVEAKQCDDPGGADTFDPASASDDLIAHAADEMAERDPQAESLHPLDCPMCGHSWQAAFEITDYLWREIEVHARRLLREIDLLARAYGWSEDQILALPPFRRRCYMELIAS